jgi:hypothetical protein
MYAKPVRPLYLICDRVQAATAWVGVAVNLLLIFWCAYWVTTADATLIPGASGMAIIILIGFFMADALSGFVHWATDTWFDEVIWDRVISIAREHHLYPSHILGYGVRDYLAYSSWPTILVLGPIELLLTLAFAPAVWLYPLVFLCLMLNTVMFFGTYFHRLGHGHSRWRVVRWLQTAHLLMGPPHHHVHHGGNHDIRYCVINGWANFVFDPIGFWRGLERLVTILTGAHPRRNDHVWRTRFCDDPDFLTTERQRVRAQCTMRQSKVTRLNGTNPMRKISPRQTSTGG